MHVKTQKGRLSESTYKLRDAKFKVNHDNDEDGDF